MRGAFVLCLGLCAFAAAATVENIGSHESRTTRDSSTARDQYTYLNTSGFAATLARGGSVTRSFVSQIAEATKQSWRSISAKFTGKKDEWDDKQSITVSATSNRSLAPTNQTGLVYSPNKPRNESSLSPTVQQIVAHQYQRETSSYQSFQATTPSVPPMFSRGISQNEHRNRLEAPYDTSSATPTITPTSASELPERSSSFSRVSFTNSIQPTITPSPHLPHLDTQNGKAGPRQVGFIGMQPLKPTITPYVTRTNSSSRVPDGSFVAEASSGPTKTDNTEGGTPINSSDPLPNSERMRPQQTIPVPLAKERARSSTPYTNNSNWQEGSETAGEKEDTSRGHSEFPAESQPAFDTSQVIVHESTDNESKSTRNRTRSRNTSSPYNANTPHEPRQNLANTSSDIERGTESKSTAMPVTLSSTGPLTTGRVFNKMINIQQELSDPSFLTSIGDVDNNGQEDFAFRSPLENHSRGAIRIYLMSSATEAHTSRHLVPGKWGFEERSLKKGDHFGHAVVPLGDLNGDGVGDIAVSAPGDDKKETSRGAVYILLLKIDGSVLSSKKFSSDEDGFLLSFHAVDERWGSTLYAVNDLDGDDVDDLLVVSASGTITPLFLAKNGGARVGGRLPPVMGSAMIRLAKYSSNGEKTLGEKLPKPLKYVAKLGTLEEDDTRGQTTLITTVRKASRKSSGPPCHFSDRSCQCKQVASVPDSKECLDVLRRLDDGRTICARTDCAPAYVCSCDSNSETVCHRVKEKVTEYQIDAENGDEEVICHARTSDKFVLRRVDV